MSRKSGTLIFVSVFALDRLTKAAAFFLIPDHIVFNAPLLPVGVLGVFIVMLAAWFVHERSGAAAVILSGALSNVVDVVWYGAVIDWISIPQLTVFNLADVFIVVGCALALVSF